MSDANDNPQYCVRIANGGFLRHVTRKGKYNALCGHIPVSSGGRVNRAGWKFSGSFGLSDLELIRKQGRLCKECWRRLDKLLASNDESGDANASPAQILAMRTYLSPTNGDPFSKDGMRCLASQCLDAGRVADSSLLEMAGLALKRLLNEAP